MHILADTIPLVYGTRKTYLNSFHVSYKMGNVNERAKQKQDKKLLWDNASIHNHKKMLHMLNSGRSLCENVEMPKCMLHKSCTLSALWLYMDCMRYQ